MRSRLVILLLVLVVLPLGLTGWLGRLFWQREVTNWQFEQKSLALHELEGRQQALHEALLKIEVTLRNLLQFAGDDRTRLVGASSKQPLIRSAFLVGSTGELKTPDPGRSELYSDEDREFLTRTASIWSRGDTLGMQHRNESGGVSASSQGWHVWYHQDGPHWLYWQRHADGSKSGFEIERIALLGRLIGGMKADVASDCLRLVSADGELLMQQGILEPDETTAPLAVLPCANPLQHWHWEFFASSAARQAPGMLPYLLGFGGVAALLAAVGMLMFLAYRRDMREAAQRVSFVNQVSHELKTPLTNIRLYVDLARDSAGQEGNALLDVVEEETSRLSRMIHNVLTFARHEKQALELHPVASDLGEVVVRVVERWRVLLMRKEIAMRVENSLSNPARFDPDAVEQVLGNLLSNVEKYAAAAKLVLMTLGEENNRARLSVQDDGPGIPKKEAARVFDAFYRSRTDLTEGVTGTGLGLSIARALAVAQDGSLELVEIERGACFVLTLPLAEANPNVIPNA